jgi:2-polyprenyl-3-methyl-5-hydroxy-6-metoxy-1,4-benzoquinol methylase
MGFVHPWPGAETVAALYSEDYAYYADEDASAAREGRSLKFATAGMRYRHLVDRGVAARLGAGLAVLIELGTRKTFTYTLGIPLDLPRDAPMLDFGCGTGRWLQSMKVKGYSNLAGFDIAANSRLRSRLEGVGIGVFDQHGLDEVRPGAFRLIRMEHVVEHLQSPAATLRRLRELLVPGGWMVLTIPSIHPWLDEPDLANSPNRPHLQLPMHLTHHSRQSIARILNEAGFEVAGLRMTRNESFLTVAAVPAAANPGPR